MYTVVTGTERQMFVRHVLTGSTLVLKYHRTHMVGHLTNVCCKLLCFAHSVSRMMVEDGDLCMRMDCFLFDSNILHPCTMWLEGLNINMQDNSMGYEAINLISTQTHTWILQVPVEFIPGLTLTVCCFYSARQTIQSNFNTCILIYSLSTECLIFHCSSTCVKMLLYTYYGLKTD